MLWSGSYTSPVTHNRCKSTESFLAAATTAPFFEFWVPYEELGEDHFDRRRSGGAYAERLVRQLERLGHKVALEPLPQSA